MSIYIELFLIFIQIGMFSIGGGYAAIPLIQDLVVETNNWLTMAEFADIVTIAEMTPGPILINSATFVGMSIAGLPGAIISTIGSVFPSAIIVLTLAYLFEKYRDFPIIQGILKGLRPAIVALILSAGLSLLFLAIRPDGIVFANYKDTNTIALIIFLIAFFVLRKFKLNPILIMFVTGIIGIFFYL